MPPIQFPAYQKLRIIGKRNEKQAHLRRDLNRTSHVQNVEHCKKEG